MVQIYMKTILNTREYNREQTDKQAHSGKEDSSFDVIKMPNRP